MKIKLLDNIRSTLKKKVTRLIRVYDVWNGKNSNCLSHMLLEEFV